MFGFDTQQGLIEDAVSFTVCVELVSGTISENTVLEIGSGAPGDTATGNCILSQEHNFLKWFSFILQLMRIILAC